VIDGILKILGLKMFSKPEIDDVGVELAKYVVP
jgi:hypothetical protein